MLDINAELLSTLIQNDINKTKDSGFSLPENRQIILEKIETEKKVMAESKKEDTTFIALLESIKEIMPNNVIKEEEFEESNNLNIKNESKDYIITYKKFVSKFFDEMLEDETKNDATVEAFISSILSVVDIFSDKGILPKYVCMSESQFNLVKAQLKSVVEANLEDVQHLDVFESMYPELETMMDKDAVMSIKDSIKQYTSMLDALIVKKNVNKMTDDEKELLKIYIYDRNGLFDYLTGKYIVKHELM